MKKWSSYAVNSPTDIVHNGSHDMGGHRMSAIDFLPLPLIP